MSVVLVLLLLGISVGGATAQPVPAVQPPPGAVTAAEQEVRAFIAAYNADYAKNDLDAYFRAFATDLTQWFPQGRVDLAAYRASWTKYIAAGNAVQRAEVRDLQVQVGPSGDAAVATYVLRVTTRTVKGEVTVEDNQETDVLFKRAGAWTIVHVNYAPARTQPKAEEH
jgi:ketosteroid isomerase-like protein